MRKPSPISTSWPRATSTSPPRAVAAKASSTAAALLLTASASSAPVTVQSTSCTWSWREARCAARQAVLEVGVAGGGGDDRVDRLLRQQRPAEIGVHDHAGGVDDAAQRRRDRRREQPRRPGHEGGRREVRRLGGGRLAGRPRRQDVGPQPLDDRAHGVHDELARG